jgi:hypothetical protein
LAATDGEGIIGNSNGIELSNGEEESMAGKESLDLLYDGLALLIRRHRNMERAGLVPEPSAEAITEMSCRIIDAPIDEGLRRSARELLATHGVADWTIHAANCRELCKGGQLEEALNYCKAQHITPPKCPIGFEADYHQKTQDRVAETISNPEWWEPRIKERERIARLRRTGRTHP